MTNLAHTPDFTIPGLIESLPRRSEPYWNILEYCRHIGVEKRPGETRDYWVGRIRKLDGKYKQRRLAPIANRSTGVAYERAVELAREWFTSPEIAAIASRAYPVGNTLRLTYRSEGGPFTVGDALVDYVEWKRLVATPSHLAVTVSRINYHILPRLGQVPAEDLTGLHIRRFMEDLLRTPPKRGNQPPGAKRKISELSEEDFRKRKKTLNAVLGVLRGCLRLAWENGTIQNERAWRCIHNVPNFDAPRVIALSREECRRLIACCRPDLRQLVLGALYTGCRVTELTRLRIRDVGGSVFGIYVWRGKGYRSRHVYLPDEGMSFFVGLCAGRAEDDRVFLHRGSHPWIDSTHRHLFKEAIRMADLPEEFCFHGLRHTYASQLVQAGTPLIVVARQLGHATVDCVLKTYGHLAPTSQEAEIRARFATLDEREAQKASEGRPRLERVNRSLQHLEPDEDEPQGRHRAWPRSNFYRGTPVEH